MEIKQKKIPANCGLQLKDNKPEPDPLIFAKNIQFLI